MLLQQNILGSPLLMTSHGLQTLIIQQKKANQTIGFLKRNIRVHNKDLKSVAYKALVRPQLEYASTVWYPHHDKDIKKLKQFKEGLQGGQSETIHTLPASLLY